MVSAGLVLTGVSLVATLVLLVLTLVPRSVHLPTWVPVPSLVAVGVLFAGAMGVGYRVYSRTTVIRPRTGFRWFLRRRWNPFSSFTRPQIAWHVVLFAIMGLVFASDARYTGELPGFSATTHRYILAGKVISETTYYNAIANWERDLLATAFFVLSLAAVIYFNERRWLARGWVRPRAPIHPRQWTWATAALAATTLVGVCVIGLTGDVAISKFNAYMAPPELPLSGARTLTLGAGEQIIFQGCPHSGSCAHLLPSQVTVTYVANGSKINVIADPSKDDLSPNDMPSGGSLVFYAPQRGRYTIQTSAPRAGSLMVALGEGQELRAMIPWILLPFVGLAIVAIACIMTAARRRKQHTQPAPPKEVVDELPWPWNQLPTAAGTP